MSGLFTSFLKKRTAFFIFSLLAYVLLFVLIGRRAGHGAIIGLLPVLAAAICWGWRAGLAAGIFSFPVSMLMLTVIGLDWRTGMLSSVGIVGHIAFIIEGLLVGWMRDLYMQREGVNKLLQQEIAQRTRDMELIRSTEQRLETIIQESVDAIVITGKLLSNIDIANRAFLKFVGRTVEDVIGRSIFDFMPVAEKRYETVLGDELIVDDQMYSHMLDKTLELAERGCVSNWEFFLLNGSGQPAPVEANAAIFFTGQGETEGSVVIFRDITQRKLSERLARSSQDLFENIIENSLDGIIISDSAGLILSINRSGQEIIGHELDEVLGLTPTAFAFFDEGTYETTAGEQVRVSQDYFVDVNASIEKFLHDGKLSNFFFYLKRRDGRLVEVEDNISTLYSQDGRLIGSVSIMRDITARRRMEHELIRQRDQLAVANRELESFSYSVSHDLRAPLRSISGFASALTEDFSQLLPAEGQRYLERIQASARRMNSLIEDMLKLSRVTRHEMRREHINLSAVAADIAVRLREQEPGRDVSCTIEPDIMAMGDGHLLRIALENLLDNAWKYTGTRHRADIFFGFASERDGDMPEKPRGTAVYCMRDNGVGFDMAYADKLFGAFQRLHAEREFPGTGIGLATVQRIVHRHGGSIWARSAPEDGATFYFTLAQEGQWTSAS